ncbi:MAG: AbrB/MazE/SpoVT family DNA-binding domain-containing protein [Candidatus Bathyarchaeia archaeon]
MTEKYRSRVGAKGQVVVAKELREKHGIREGGLVEQISTERGVLLVPVSVDDLLKELDAVAEEIGESWPKGVSAVEAIRADRERQR